MKNNKYATLDMSEAMGFREITQELLKDGHRITAAKTRLILLSVLEKIIKNVAKKQGKSMSKNMIYESVQNPAFQNTIAPIIEMAYFYEDK